MCNAYSMTKSRDAMRDIAKVLDNRTPATSYCDPDGGTPAKWHWFAIEPVAQRPLFFCPGIWKRYSGPVKKNGPDVDLEAFSFMTTVPNALAGTINHERMPVVFTEEREFDIWLNGSPDEAHALVHAFPAERMQIVQSGAKGPDLASPIG